MAFQQVDVVLPGVDPAVLERRLPLVPHLKEDRIVNLTVVQFKLDAAVVRDGGLLTLVVPRR